MGEGRGCVAAEGREFAGECEVQCQPISALRRGVLKQAFRREGVCPVARFWENIEGDGIS